MNNEPTKSQYVEPVYVSTETMIAVREKHQRALILPTLGLKRGDLITLVQADARPGIREWRRVVKVAHVLNLEGEVLVSIKLVKS